MDDLHASGVTGFTGLERIVPSPSAMIVRMVNVDNLHASGVTGFTGLARIVPSPSAMIVRMVNVDDLQASGAAGFTGQASYPCPARGAVARAGSRFTSAAAWIVCGGPSPCFLGG